MAKNLKEREKQSTKEAEVAAREETKQIAEETKKAEKAAKLARKSAEQTAKLQARIQVKAARQAKKGPGIFDRRLTSLYIDDTSMKLLVSKGRHIIKWAEMRLEPGMVNDGVIADPADMAVRVKDLFRDQNIKDRKVIVGLSGLHCLSRVITLPSLSGSVLAEAVKREAERELPVSLDNLYLAWQVVGATKQESKVFLVVHTRSVADAMVETLRRAGLKPQIMDLAPLALTRVANEKTAVIVDVRASELDLIIMVNGVPELIRSLPLPQDQSLQEKTPIIKEELERTIKFYDTTESKAPLKQRLSVFVSGELVNKPELYESMQKELGYTTISPLPPFRYPAGLVPSDYMVNIGLILKSLYLGRETGLSKVNINALPEVYRKGLPAGKVLGTAGAAVAIGLVVLAIMQVQSNGATLNSLRNDLDAANIILVQRQAQQRSQNEAIAALNDQLAASTQTASTLNAVLNTIGVQRDVATVDLPLVTASVIDTLSLSAIGQSADTLTLKGHASAESTILSYAQRLKDSGRYSEIVVTDMTNNGKTIDFSLTLKK